jgi:hypothetical protein
MAPIGAATVCAKKFFADNHVDYLWINLEKDEVELN